MTSHIIPDADFHIDIARGNKNEFSVNHKFGRNALVGTSFVLISNGGVYQTPQVSGATQLRIKAGNANDTANGSGARTVFIQGLSASGALISETLTTNGASNGTASVNSYLRLFRTYVLTSGTYGSTAAGSHSADIVIENAAGGTTWATIDSTSFPKGQGEIAAYSVPLGYQAWIKNIFIHVESSKPTDVLLFQRQNILQTSAPYSPVRLVYSAIGITNELMITRQIPLGPYAALTEFGFMGKTASGTAAVSVNFDILLAAV